MKIKTESLVQTKMRSPIMIFCSFVTISYDCCETIKCSLCRNKSADLKPKQFSLQFKLEFKHGGADEKDPMAGYTRVECQISSKYRRENRHMQK